MEIYISGSPAIATTSTIGFAFTAASTAFYRWKNLGEKMQRHFDIAQRYQELAEDIDHHLSRDRRFRPAADAAMTSFRLTKQRIDSQAPPTGDGKGSCSF